MRYAHKTLRKRWILRLHGSLVIGLFFIVITGGLSLANAVSCGENITTNTKLTGNLNCAAWSEEDAALTVDDGIILDLNGFKIIGNSDIYCIEIIGSDAIVMNGTVKGCDRGVRVGGDGGNEISHITAIGNGRGFEVRSENNKLLENFAIKNEQEGFRVRDDCNTLYRNQAIGNGEDGIRIESSNNSVTMNMCIKNGREGIDCDDGVENYFYGNMSNSNATAGIEFDNASHNEAVNNRCHGNKEDGIRLIEGSDFNIVRYNTALGNKGFDLRDDYDMTEPCDTNIWCGNRFKSFNEPCVSEPICSTQCEE